MNILHLTGMNSTKYGGLEKYFVKLAKVSNNDRIIVNYNTFPECESYVEDLSKEGGLIVSDIRFDSLLSLLNYVRKNEIDVVHLHFCDFSIILILQILFCKIFSSVKFVKTIHSEVRKPRNLPGLLKFKFGYSMMDLILPVSRIIKSQIVSVLKTDNAVRVHYLGVEINNFDRDVVRRKFGWTDDFVFVSVGWNNYIKGFDLLVDAFSRIKSGKNIKLIIVGQSDVEQNKLYPQIEKYDSGSKIEMWGIRNNVPEILKGADVYIQASRTEALPLTIAEAHFAGLPVISSRVGGVEEIVKNNYNGMVFESGNVDELACDMQSLVNDSNLCRILGLNAFSGAADFSLDKSVRGLSQIYRELFNGKGKQK